MNAYDSYIKDRDYYRDFEAKYQAKIEDSREYRQWVKNPSYPTWDDEKQLVCDTEVKVVPMKAVHLTSDSLEQLLRQEERFERLRSDAEYGKKIVGMLRADERVRDANPAVQKAYIKYITLLELART